MDPKFKSLPNLISRIHELNMKFIPIIDYGIPQTMTDKYYEMGIKSNAFIISNYTNKPLITKTWPGDSVFLDLLRNDGQNVWTEGLDNFYEILKYDGIWLDLNEPGSTEVFKNGKGEILSSFDETKNIYKNIPYIPGYRKGRTDL